LAGKNSEKQQKEEATRAIKEYQGHLIILRQPILWPRSLHCLCVLAHSRQIEAILVS
jgi:hypothetical protein